MKPSIMLFCITVLLASCSHMGKKAYYYTEDGLKEDTIYAYNDSQAYLEAVKKFQISLKVYREMKDAFADYSGTQPLQFIITNDKHEDISGVNFKNKDSLVAMTQIGIDTIPSSLKENVKTIKERTQGALLYDTTGLYAAPVKVLNARFTHKDYSTYKDVTLTFKNVSGKKISAIRFRWYGINAFNEAADMTGMIDGWGGGFDDDALRIGETRTATWDALSRDGKKIQIAFPYEVAFDDGTNWKLKE
ncbi:MAG: hypothetical protein JST82_09805 [Bacteroidetes bacterium]|nr:hypothetical protein [Bacteroidota bacterium]